MFHSHNNYNKDENIKIYQSASLFIVLSKFRDEIVTIPTRN